MEFITLTAKFSGTPAYINPKYITDIYRATDDSCTYVGIAGHPENCYLVVVESPQAILDLITILHERNN